MSTTAIAKEACEVVAYAPAPDAPLEKVLAEAPSNALGCAQGVAAHLPGGVRVWRCAVDYAEGEVPEPGAATTGLLVQIGPQVVFQGTGPMTGGSLADLRVVSVDLSGDHLEEWVVAVRTSESQGLGMSRWDLHAFTPAWIPVGTLSDVVGWGPTAFIKRDEGRGCAALITHLRETDGPGDRSDTLLTGHAAVVTEVGGFERQGAEPLFERRLDAAFRTEWAAWVAKGNKVEGNPLSWFHADSDLERAR